MLQNKERFVPPYTPFTLALTLYSLTTRQFTGFQHDRENVKKARVEMLYYKIVTCEYNSFGFGRNITIYLFHLNCIRDGMADRKSVV